MNKKANEWGKYEIEYGHYLNAESKVDITLTIRLEFGSFERQ